MALASVPVVVGPGLGEALCSGVFDDEQPDRSIAQISKMASIKFNIGLKRISLTQNNYISSKAAPDELFVNIV
ncbi:hypothetical protein SDC9_182307 [bioreactor metagenome]|uniref:Uncharacterized protein n=1 Tax=bioreactor metagenome TaxID=1076179 RepID=A0A645HGK8_9ZZZZ